MDLTADDLGLVVGTALAVALAVFARLIGLDRDRAFYPTVTIVVASYYVLFAVIAASTDLLTEIAVFTLFAGLATIGFRTSLWVVSAALALHGIFDFLRQFVLAGQGVPQWWPSFCGAYDVAAALILALLLLAEGRKARP